MKIEDLKTVLIIGAGTMGQQIGFISAAHGYDVVLYDVSAEMLEKALQRATALADHFVAAGRLTREAADAALGRMRTTRDPEDAGRDADLVSESVPEDPALKAKVFAQFNAVCPERTVFTTNTSSLVPSMFAEATGRPDRFLAFHFHDVKVTPVVDIMPHPGTSPEAVQLVTDFCEKTHLIAIHLQKENFGYVFNAMLMDLFKTAQTLAANGVSSVTDIDRAWMGIMHTEVGPFGIMDSIGLDTVWKVTDYWAEQLKDPQARANAAFIKQYVDQGALGLKAGRGFYSYPNPAFGQSGFVEGKTV